jgi:formylglycine-generating enzyme required for sulfatase activity
MALVAGGEMMMGSDDGADDERPVHRVRVGDLCMDVTEVTLSAYLACVSRGACRSPSLSVEYGGLTPEVRAVESAACNGNQSRGAVPINCVTFAQATAFCEANGKHLPTEEEWEYAARGGAEQRRFPWGSDPPGPKLLNACGAECARAFAKDGIPLSPLYPGDDGFPTWAPVGSFPAGDSRDGIHDLAGNVSEWTASPYCPYPDHACKGPYRVVRGGSFASEFVTYVRATGRLYSRPENRFMQIGFRCARDAAPP